MKSHKLYRITRNVFITLILLGASVAHAGEIKSTYKTGNSGSAYFKDNRFRDYVDLRYTGSVGSGYRVNGVLLHLTEDSRGRRWSWVGRYWGDAAGATGWGNRFRVNYRTLENRAEFPEYGFRMLWFKTKDNSNVQIARLVDRR